MPRPDGGFGTPLVHRVFPWSDDAFGGDVRELEGVRCRVLSLAALARGKAHPRDDPDEVARDCADLETPRGI